MMGPPFRVPTQADPELEGLLQDLDLMRLVPILRLHEVDMAALRLLSDPDLAELGVSLGAR